MYENRKTENHTMQYTNIKEIHLNYRKILFNLTAMIFFFNEIRKSSN